MFITKITIKNFRLFSSNKLFEVDNINIPDSQNEGSGLTTFVGENGCGKTSLLDALALPLLSYKTESFAVDDFYDPGVKTVIEIFSKDNFSVDGTMPKSIFSAKGFSFEAGIRARENKNYLSSIIVSDQKYIRVDPSKPKDGSPDLRIAVNNPFKGPRFNENDILFLDKNRLFQTRSGTYNKTRFDRLMEDFDFQYIKGKTNGVDNLNEDLNSKIKTNIENKFLKNAIKKFSEISSSTITLEFIDNWRPFNKGFFAEKKANNQQISLSMLGSGYEMIFSLLYSFYLSQQSGKQLIVLIDEPDLHLHPSLQEDFVKVLLEFSKNAQIILTSHSPLFLKQLSHNEKVKIIIMDRKGSQQPEVIAMNKMVLPYASASEVNYLAFGLPTVELHDEIYGFLHQKYIDNATDEQEAKKRSYLDEFDDYLKTKTTQTRKWTPEQGWTTKTESDITLQTFIRNKTHHPENKTMQDKNFTDKELRQSIDEMIKII